jgi:hypothetical protein
MGYLTSGTTELHIDYGGYRVWLGLLINLDKAHRFDRVVMVDKPLPSWGEIDPSYNKAA